MNTDASPTRPLGIIRRSVALDTGLRRYMLSFYNYMAAGLGLTGLVAYIAVATGFYQQIAATPPIGVVMPAPLAAVLFLSFPLERMSIAAAQAVFWGYAPSYGGRSPAFCWSAREPARPACSSSALELSRR